MDKVIRNKLEEQLRVLSHFIDEYSAQLCGSILSKHEFYDLESQVNNIYAKLFDMRVDERINTEVMS